MISHDSRPLIVHILHRLDFGGLENGLVNLVNNLPEDEFRHHIVSMTEVSTISERITRRNVTVEALNKRPGKDLLTYWRLLRRLRVLKPAVLHTRNVGTLDCQIVARLAGVPRRVHGEHGWDVDDPDGMKRKFRRLRKILFPLVHRIVPLSKELESYVLGLDASYAERLTRIRNGVDLARFPHRRAVGQQLSPVPVFGSVTRFSDIKAPLNTIRAFAALRKSHRARLIMVGDGPLLDKARALVQELALEDDIDFAGAQLDVAPWFARFDVFVLSSLREGISNTILEAMAAGLPVVASAVGGNVELVAEGETGHLVQPGDVGQLASVMRRFCDDRDALSAQGVAARSRAEQCYALSGMVEAYRQMYLQEIRASGAV